MYKEYEKSNLQSNFNRLSPYIHDCCNNNDCEWY